MRIVIADYSGHPFQVQLSREMARRGNEVLHLYFSEFQTPRGRLEKSEDDPQLLQIESIALGVPFEKHRFYKRWIQENKVGEKFAERIRKFSPEVVVASNLPLDALRRVQKSAAASGFAFVFWQQDIYSIAIDRILRAKMKMFGAAIGQIYRSIERKVLRQSQCIVAISEDFAPYLENEFGIERNAIHIVHNWAPLDEISVRPKDNAWASENGFCGKKIVLYTGTLGLKHDPGLILELAKRLNERNDVEVVVASEGPGADWLKLEARTRNIRVLKIIPFQPYERYSEVLATANVLICILEPDAGVFSVPSKVLSYLCSGRAIVLSAPSENLASRIVSTVAAGIVSKPGQANSFTESVLSLLNDDMKSVRAGESGRHYAEKYFNIVGIADKFEVILAKACDAMR